MECTNQSISSGSCVRGLRKISTRWPALLNPSLFVNLGLGLILSMATDQKKATILIPAPRTFLRGVYTVSLCPCGFSPGAPATTWRRLMEPDWSLIMTGLVANNLPKYFPKCFSSVDCQNYYFSSPKPNWGHKSDVKYVGCWLHFWLPPKGVP